MDDAPLSGPSLGAATGNPLPMFDRHFALEPPAAGIAKKSE